jgi:RND family efflux transporter MFP subunit
MSQADLQAASSRVSTAEAEVQAATEAVESARADVSAAQSDVQSSAEKVNAAKAAVQAAKANEKAAQDAFRASQSGTTAAGASIRSNQANAMRANAIRSYEKIVAPFSGVITARNVEVGDLVNPTSTGTGASDQSNTVTRTGLFGLARTDVLLAEANVPESFVPSIREGEQATLSVQELPGKTYTGTVYRMAGAIDATSRTMLVELKVPNQTGVLKPGMFAQVSFSGNAGQTTLRIPSNALIFDADGTRAAVLRPDGTVHFVTVTVAQDMGDYIDIATGLTDKDVVITNPAAGLKEGERVTAVQGAQ